MGDKMKMYDIFVIILSCCIIEVVDLKFVTYSIRFNFIVIVQSISIESILAICT